MEINVYPNPAHENLTIMLSERGIRAFEIMLISSKGKVAYFNKVENYKDFQDYSIDISGISKGNYALYISTEDHTWSRKVLIQ